MYNGSNCVRKPQLSDILTEPLNPREFYRVIGKILIDFSVSAWTSFFLSIPAKYWNKPNLDAARPTIWLNILCKWYSICIRNFCLTYNYRVYNNLYWIIKCRLWYLIVIKWQRLHFVSLSILKCAFIIENRIYIQGEFKESLGINFFSPFQPEREFKVYKSCKCSQIICSRVH